MTHTAGFLAIAFLADAALTVAVVSYVVRKRAASGAADVSPGVDLVKFKAFSDSARALVGEYLRSNYGGDAAELPGVLSELLIQLDDSAKEQSLTLDRTTLRMVLLRSVQALNTIPSRDVQTALRQVA
jgi:hypothetical protein